MIKLFTRFRLIKRNPLSKKRAANLDITVTERPRLYRETSDDDSTPGNNLGHQHINAHELFNMFTADIIKKETVFIR